MADLPRYLRDCLQSGKLAMLAILVSGACALYNNWWPMLTVLIFVLLPMPLIFFVGFGSSSLFTVSSSGCKPMNRIDWSYFSSAQMTVPHLQPPVKSSNGRPSTGARPQLSIMVINHTLRRTQHRY